MKPLIIIHRPHTSSEKNDFARESVFKELTPDYCVIVIESSSTQDYGITIIGDDSLKVITQIKA